MKQVEWVSEIRMGRYKRVERNSEREAYKDKGAYKHRGKINWLINTGECKDNGCHGSLYGPGHAGVEGGKYLGEEPGFIYGLNDIGPNGPGPRPGDPRSVTI